MTARAQILRLLAGGGCHSGTALGGHLGISRAAVCKHVNTLVAMGVEIDRVPRRGYRLAAPLMPLEAEQVLAQIPAAGGAICLEVLEEVDSTNLHLARRIGAGTARSGQVCLAEVQHGGRGRRGRGWAATPYGSILMSIAWRFQAGPAVVAGLSLAAGVAVGRALADYGVAEIGLKWPNDVFWRGGKLAGLLVDIHGEAAGPCWAVVGVGVNGYLAPAAAGTVDQPWTDLSRITGRPVDRNRLAALLTAQLFKLLQAFESDGFAAFRADWERYHLHAQQAVRLVSGEQVYHGVVQGVDSQGALLLREPGGAVRAFHSGDISLRPAG